MILFQPRSVNQMMTLVQTFTKSKTSKMKKTKTNIAGTNIVARKTTNQVIATVASPTPPTEAITITELNK